MYRMFLFLLHFPIDPTRQVLPDYYSFDPVFIKQHNIRQILITEGEKVELPDARFYFDREGRLLKIVEYTSSSTVFGYTEWLPDSTGCPQEFDDEGEHLTRCRCDEDNRIVSANDGMFMHKFRRDNTGHLTDCAEISLPEGVNSENSRFTYDSEGRCIDERAKAMLYEADSTGDYVPTDKLMEYSNQFVWSGSHLITYSWAIIDDMRDTTKNGEDNFLWSDPLNAEWNSFEKKEQMHSAGRITYYPIGLAKEIKYSEEGALRPEDEIHTIRFTYEIW